jgi:hypothetical protein
MFIERFRADHLGQDAAVVEVLKHVSSGEMVNVRGSVISRIMDLMREKPSFHPNPSDFYRLYLAYHPSSGYRTVFNEHGEPSIIPPRGGVLCAFFYEIVVLEEVGVVVSFPSKK